MRITTILTLGASIALATSASAALINADFETGDLTGWTTGNTWGGWEAAVDMTIDSTTQLAGDHSLSTGIAQVTMANTQNTGTLTDFTYSMLFRIDGWGNRAMDWNLGDAVGGTANGDMRFKVDSGGIVGLGLNGTATGSWANLNGSTFTPTLGTTYRWDITASGFDGVGGDTASFDVEIFAGATSLYTSLNNSFTTGAADKLAVESVNFTRGGNWGGGGYTVDSVAIPEPATLGMVALFGGGLLFIRRKLAM